MPGAIVQNTPALSRLDSHAMNQSFLKLNLKLSIEQTVETELKASLTVHISFWSLISLWWEACIFNNDGLMELREYIVLSFLLL